MTQPQRLQALYQIAQNQEVVPYHSRGQFWDINLIVLVHVIDIIDIIDIIDLLISYSNSNIIYPI
jgi:hypothetical protein